MMCDYALLTEVSMLTPPDLGAKTQRQAEMFQNRLTKRAQYFQKRMKRDRIDAYRVYDRDIPEIPLSVDIYQLTTDAVKETYAVVALFERPYEKDPREEAIWLEAMLKAAETALQLAPQHTILKTRKKQKGRDQYNKSSNPSQPVLGTVGEGDLRFHVNLTDYLDTGLFLDHRPLRQNLIRTCADKRVLNLFGYTGALSVAAAKGGASFVQTVDLSNTYLSWAEKNLQLNGIAPARYGLTRGDVVEFLRLENRKRQAANTSSTTDKRFDVILLDPPTFSNSSMTADVLDINRQWPELVELCLPLLRPNGTLYFSTNSRRLAFDPQKIPAHIGQCTVAIADITPQSLPEDFKAHRIHRCWKIQIQP